MSFRKAIPNLVSLPRALLAPFVMILAIRQEWILALGVLAVSITSDWLDGWLAVKLRAKSEFGRIYLETGCDLIMTIRALGGLLFAGVIPWWPLWPLVAVAVLIWPVVVFIPERKRLRRICSSACPLYYLTVIMSVLGIYCVKALGVWALCLFFLAIPAVLAKRHRLMSWLGGKSH